MFMKRILAAGIAVAAVGTFATQEAHSQVFTQTLMDGYSCSDAEYGATGAYFTGNSFGYASRSEYTSACTVGNTANSAGAVITATQTLRAATAQTVGIISNRVQAVRSALRAEEGLAVSAFSFNDTNGELGLSAGDMSKGVGVWVQGEYTYVDYDAAAAQFDGYIITGMAGIDKLLLNDRVLVGLSFGYEIGDYETTFNNGNVEQTGFLVAPYVSFRPNSIISIDATGGYGTFEIDQDRRDTATNNETFNSTTDATRYFGSAVINADHAYKKFLFGATAGASYTIESRDAFTETGNAGNSVAVGASSTRIGQALFGANVAYDAGKARPFASVRGEYDFSKSEGITVGTNQSAPEESDFGVRVGLGVNFDIMPGLTGTISGDTVLVREDYTEYSGLGRLRFEF